MTKNNSSTKNHVSKIEYFSNVQKFVNYGAGIVVFIYGGYEVMKQILKDIIGLNPTFNPNVYSIILKIIVIFVYFSFFFGLKMDIEDEKSVLLIPPNKGKLNPNMIIFFMTSIVVFAIFVLSLSSDDINTINKTKTLLGFIIAFDIFAIHGEYAKIKVEKIAKISKIENEDFLNSKENSMEKIDWSISKLSIKALEDYLLGDWWKVRTFYNFILLFFINIVFFTDLYQIIAVKIHLPFNEDSKNLITVCLIAFYFLSLECWVWYYRLKRKMYLLALQDTKKTLQEINTTI